MDEHTAYIHREAGESSLRCSCGQWKGRHLVDHAGHAEHVRYLIEAEALEALALATTVHGPMTPEQLRITAFMLRKGRVLLHDYLMTSEDLSNAAATNPEKENS